MANLKELRRSPLASYSEALAEASSAELSVAEVPFATQIGVRVAIGTTGYQKLLGALEAGLPAGVGEVAGEPDGVATLWLSPDEFLVVAPEGAGLEQADALLNKLTEALGDNPGQVLNLSANRTIIELKGEKARLVLRKSNPLDLGSIGVNQAYVTELAQVPVLLWRSAENTWRIMPRVSFANHVANWLIDALREFN